MSHFQISTVSIKIVCILYSGHQTSLVFEWSKRGRMPNGLVFECHLNTGQMDPILYSYVLVRYSNGRSSTKDITYRPTIWIPNHLKSKLRKCFRYSNGRYSNSYYTGKIVISTLIQFLWMYRGPVFGYCKSKKLPWHDVACDLSYLQSQRQGV